MRGRGATLVATILLGGQLVSGSPEAEATSVEEIEQKLKALQDQVNELRQQLDAAKSTSAPAPTSSAPAATPSPSTALTAPFNPMPPTGDKAIFGILPSPLEGLRLGAYGETNFGTRQNPAHNGQWQNGFDASRFVLLPSYQFTDSIVLNAEIEFEHAGSGFDAELWVDPELVYMTGDIPLLSGLLRGPLATGLKQIVQQAFPPRLT